MWKVKIKTLSILLVVLLGLIVAACGNLTSTPPVTSSPEATGSAGVSEGQTAVDIFDARAVRAHFYGAGGHRESRQAKLPVSAVF